MTGVSTPAPPSLRWAIGLLAGEAVVIAGLAGLAGYSDLTGAADDPGTGWGITGFAAGFAALVAFLAWALTRRHGWARAPALVTELMLLPIGYYMITGGQPWFGVPVLLLGLVGAGLLIAPASREALGVR